MILMTILGCIAIYVILSILFGLLVRKLLKKRIITWLVIGFVVIFPAWDWLLGIIVYYPACLIVPKDAVYQTSETDGIYYEGVHDYLREGYRKSNDQPLSEITRVGLIDLGFNKGFTYAEARVTKTRQTVGRSFQSIDPEYYRCTPLPEAEIRPDYIPTNCIRIDRPTSRFLVRETTKRIATAEIDIKKVIDRPSGNLMAEYRQVKRTLYPLPPFFYWLINPFSGQHEESCPPDGKPYLASPYHAFEYKVLKPTSETITRR